MSSTDTPAPDLAALVASGRELTAHRFETADLEGDRRTAKRKEQAWRLLPALLDAAQSAQERAEAAEREASRAYDEGAETAMAISNRVVRESGLERIAMQQDRDAAQAALAQVREALGWYADPMNWEEQHDPIMRVIWRLAYNDRGRRARAALDTLKGDTNGVSVPE